MANYTAADVKKLRETTGSGMLACKKALEESDGNFDKAVEILRIKGAKDVGKRAERTADEGLKALSAKIGEKLQLRRAVTLEGDNVAVYLHHRSADLPPSVGVLVAYTGDDEQAAKAVAMQVAALKAKYLTREDVPEEVVAKEREIAEATAKEEGKPEKALPKIVEGRVNGFFKDVVLLDQPSVTESKKTVKQVADEAGITLTGFVRYEVGQD
ncbi:translation elongation factor Ts [Corynebacterium bovis]|uniref:translation elongation factor Ts n=1 Tax=Corynebacterium bovis TaxID=36808 RepID=UPI0031386C96